HLSAPVLRRGSFANRENFRRPSQTSADRRSGQPLWDRGLDEFSPMVFLGHEQSRPGSHRTDRHARLAFPVLSRPPPALNAGTAGGPEFPRAERLVREEIIAPDRLPRNLPHNTAASHPSAA